MGSECSLTHLCIDFCCKSLLLFVCLLRESFLLHFDFFEFYQFTSFFISPKHTKAETSKWKIWTCPSVTQFERNLCDWMETNRNVKKIWTSPCVIHRLNKHWCQKNLYMPLKEINVKQRKNVRNNKYMSLFICDSLCQFVD